MRSPVSQRPHHFNFHTSSLLVASTERRYVRKRLSHCQAKGDAGQQPEVTDNDGMDSLRLPPKVPHIEPKTEPEEQESTLADSRCSDFFFVSQLC